MSDWIQAFVPLVWRHLWETTLVVGAIMILMPLLRRQRARLRHAVWLAASAKFLVPFSFLVALGISIEWSGRPIVEVPVTSGPMRIVAIPMPVPTLGVPEVSSFSVVLGALVWITGFGTVAALWFRAQMQARGIVNTAERLARNRESATKFADVRVSDSVSSPAVFGLVHPVLVLPVDLERRLTPAERDAVVAHEMAHVGRRDNLTTAFHRVVTALFWFHPLIWWIGRQLVNERERASDESVLRTGHAPEAYASGLLKICRSAVGMPAECVAGIASRNLKTRVEGIMKHDETNRRGPVAGIVVGLMAATTFGVPLVTGLSTPEVTLATLSAEVIQVGESGQDPETSAPDSNPARVPIVGAEPAEPETNAVAFNGGVRGIGRSFLGVGYSTSSPPPAAIKEEAEGAEPVPGSQGPAQLWVEQEVLYIITEEEREAFQSLETDEERERFIEQFWLRRDPTPGTARNEMQDEHYRRIASANERFAFAATPGSQTDRGATLIMYGQPEFTAGMSGIYSLPGDDYGRPVYPFERWRYNYVEGVGEQVVFEFVDTEGTGEFHLAETPAEKFMPVDAAETEGRGASYYRAETSASRTSDASSEID